MNVLAIDTTTPLPSIVVLWRGGAFERRLRADHRASEELLVQLAEVLGEAGAALAGLSRIAVCSGPGSFTGVRIGLATAWGLGRTLGIPIESLPTLEAMAEALRGHQFERVTAALDAGRGEVTIESFTLAPDRARSTSAVRRLARAEAATLLRGQCVVCLPEDLLGLGGPTLPISPARAAALAVQRCPRDGAGPAAIYARASAAEEKLGAP